MYATGELGASTITSGPLRDGTSSLLRSVVDGWLAADVSRTEAENALMKGAYDAGAFCVRRKSGDDAVLSVLTKSGAVSHFRIVGSSGGQLQVADAAGSSKDRMFSNIHDVIAHFSTHQLTPRIPLLIGCVALPGSPTEDSGALYAMTLPVADDGTYSTPQAIKPVKTTGSSTVEYEHPSATSGNVGLYAVPNSQQDEEIFDSFEA